MADTVPRMDDLLNNAIANIVALQSQTESLLMYGRKYYVNPDAAVGSNSNDGSKNYPWLTLAYALATVSNFDTIGFTGTVTEDSLALATPNVAIVGLGFANAAAVLQNSTADKTLMTITGANCLLANFKIRPPAYTAGAPKGLSLSGANYLRLLRMRFQGKANSYDAIYSDVTSDNVLIDACEFLYMNTATYGYAIHGVAAAGTCHGAWQILNSYFSGNVNNYVAPSQHCLFRGNTMPDYGLGPSGTAIQTTKKINVSGTNAMCNQVHGNVLGGGALSHGSGYYGVATNDDWSGNQLDSGSLSASTPPTS